MPRLHIKIANQSSKTFRLLHSGLPPDTFIQSVTDLEKTTAIEADPGIRNGLPTMMIEVSIHSFLQ
jgi:hypothetical protein